MVSSSPPFQLYGFEPVERLGGGGFGEVWLARQTNIDRMVAIKVGHTPIDDKTVQLRFQRECIALGRLTGHRNIIDVFTAGQLEDGRPYLVLEYVSGGTLWQRVHQSPLSEAELIRIGIQLADALGIAHEAGVLHRDLKPENVLLRPNSEVVLGDFGIARLHDGANTTSQAIAASVAYAAPEILAGKPATIAADVYGLGVCLLAAILRSVPFVENTDESIHPIINRVLSDRPPDLRRYGISNELATVIEALLAKDPSQRPDSAGDVKRQLEQLGSPSMDATSAAPQTPDRAGQTRAIGSIPSLGSLPPPLGSSTPSGIPSNPQVTPHFQPVQVSPPAPPPTPAPSVYTISGPQPLAARTGTGDGRGGGGNRAGMFVVAFIATLLVGGLMLYLIVEATSGDDNAGSTTTTESTGSTDTAAPSSATSDTGLLGSSDPSETTGSTAATLAPLALPLTSDDLPAIFGDQPLIEPDTAGPAAAQFCSNTPLAAGLDDWVGETLTEASASDASLYQGVARFETSSQASAYVASYLATVNCTEWTEPATADNVEISIRPSISTAAATYGDDTREITYDATSPDLADVILYGRLAIVRYGTDVLNLSLQTFDQADASMLDGLLQLAVERLGY